MSALTLCSSRRCQNQLRHVGLRAISCGFAETHRHGGEDSTAAARRIRGGEPLPVAARLRLDHGALTALLVPSPTTAVVAAIRAILKAHNPVEEDPGGVYEQCEELAGAEADQILAQLQAAPEVKVLPHVDTPFLMEAARRAVARAGYDLDL